jgi:hypothetical protein
VIRAAAVVLVVLVARWLAYASEPGATARFLEHRGGGPALPAIALVALALCATLAVTVCFLVAVAVRERALLERRTVQPFGVTRAFVLAATLAVTSSVAGGLFEAYLHWRAGLGWHGLHCLLGPVHRDLLPFETGLSFVAAALIAAGRHLAAWMRRTFARLAADLPALAPAVTATFGDATALRGGLRPRLATARAPPLPG